MNGPNANARLDRTLDRFLIAFIAICVITPMSLGAVVRYTTVFGPPTAAPFPHCNALGDLVVEKGEIAEGGEPSITGVSVPDGVVNCAGYSIELRVFHGADGRLLGEIDLGTVASNEVTPVAGVVDPAAPRIRASNDNRYWIFFRSPNAQPTPAQGTQKNAS